MGVPWYPCDWPERPLDADVRFHEPPTMLVSDGQGGMRSVGSMTSFVIDGKATELTRCHGCDTAKAAAQLRIRDKVETLRREAANRKEQ